MKIQKRDGRIVDFDKVKIIHAVEKALASDGKAKEDYKNECVLIANAVEKAFASSPVVVTVEDVQDEVERNLMKIGLFDTAKKYVLYREQRTKMRRVKSKSSIELIKSYIEKNDWRVRENSNMNFSVQGLNNFISSDISTEFWLNEIYTEDIRKAHISGDIHIHDLCIVAAYCCGWDLKDLLTVGFCGVHSKVESYPPSHFFTALGQIWNFIFTLQGEAAGAQALSSFDTYLAPFVKKDNLSYEQVKQFVRHFVFNMNVATRVGFQTPFSNITMDMQCPRKMVDEPVIIGGKTVDSVRYGDCQKEMDLINRAFCEVMCEGDKKGMVFTFPIPTYNITKNFDWNSPRFEPVWKMTGKYGVPYFANFVNSDLSEEDCRSMCCRLRLDNRELIKRGGGLFGSNPLTGSIGVVTVNMPRLAYKNKQSQGSKEDFFSSLSHVMDLAKDSLVLKRKAIEDYTEAGMYPYSMFYLRDVHDRYGRWWANHFSTIGNLGMNEAAKMMVGGDLTTEEGSRFAEEVLDFMRSRMRDYQEETGDLFNLEATPAEGTSYRLARLDKKDCPGIVFANGVNKTGFCPEHPYYTNSSQLPVGATDDVFKAFTLQDSLQTKYTGGTVLHAFVGEEIKDPAVVRDLVKTLVTHFSLPYFTITPTFSVCPKCGYISGEYEKCPKCGGEADVYSRVVGYLRPVKNWNDGKKAEWKDRKPFEVR